jgi:phage recombination protein Bet
MVTELTGYQPVEIALIARTVAVDAPLQELAVFLHACRQLKLDPLLRQAYWIRRGNPPRGTLQVGIDGFRAIADRSGVYGGSEPPEYRDWIKLDGDLRVPGVARVRVWKVVEGRNAAFTGEAAWTEFYPGPGANGAMWRRMPRHMLAKVAEAQALRKAFPALLAAVNMDDEHGEDSAPDRVQVEQVEPERRRPTAADYDRIYGEPLPPQPAEAPVPEEPDEPTE